MDPTPSPHTDASQPIDVTPATTSHTSPDQSTSSNTMSVETDTTVSLGAVTSGTSDVTVSSQPQQETLTEMLKHVVPRAPDTIIQEWVQELERGFIGDVESFFNLVESPSWAQIQIFPLPVKGVIEHEAKQRKTTQGSKRKAEDELDDRDSKSRKLKRFETFDAYLEFLQQRLNFNIKSFDKGRESFTIDLASIHFIDRVDAVKQIVAHSNSVFTGTKPTVSGSCGTKHTEPTEPTKPTELIAKITKPPLFFVHGTTGAGKSRLFYEFANRFRHSPEFSDLPINFFPIAISFNSGTTLTTEDKVLAPTTLIAIRVLHALLRYCDNCPDFTKLQSQIVRDFSSGVIDTKLFSVRNILEMFTEWIGEKVLLLIDEPLYLINVTKLNEQDFTLFIHDVCTLQEGNSPIAVVFSTLKVGIFNKSATLSGRPIQNVGLSTLSIDDVANVLLTFDLTKDKIVLRNNNGVEKEVWAKTLAALTGGHPRTLEFLVKSLQVPCTSIAELLALVEREYTSSPSAKQEPFLFDLSVGVPLAFSSCPTLPATDLNIPLSLFPDPLKKIGEKLWGMNTLIVRPVDDLVSSGVLPQEGDIPVLSVVSLRHWCGQEVIRESQPRLADAIQSMISYFSADGDSFEHLCAYWEIAMRFVRQQISQIFPTKSVHQWTSRMINEVYSSPYTQLDTNIQSLRFDFTIPLDFEWFDNVMILNKKGTDELISKIWVPRKSNNPGFDSLVFLQSNEGKIYILAIENKYTLEGSKTKLNHQTDIVEKRRKAVVELTSAGYTEGQIIFVMMALRPYSAEKQQLPQNTIVIDDKEFHKLVGPTVLCVIQSSEVMVRRRNILIERNEISIDKRDRGCQCIVGATGVQCKRPAMIGKSFCYSHS